MQQTEKKIKKILGDFRFYDNHQLPLVTFKIEKTRIGNFDSEGMQYPKYINEFWTSKQRQASSLHEISYRACFKPQLPRFFIKLLSREDDIIYDPFAGRGTTLIEAALLGRNIISNDISPLSEILSRPRLFLANIREVEKRLSEIPFNYSEKANIDLSMFYGPKTESEIVSLRKYLRTKGEREDNVDSWIRMVATNRLTGHSKGYFSVYTLPPNQAVSPESQIKINKKRNQVPGYKDIRKIIIKKTKSLLRNVSKEQLGRLRRVGERGLFLIEDSRETKLIKDNSVQLTVTSPPFLDVVDYKQDNWLRCWFNDIKTKEISERIIMTKNLEEWCRMMKDTLRELYRITKKGGWVAFEVGEVKGGEVNLDEHILPLGVSVGFCVLGILLNEQEFTKTSHIWGIKNNRSGTNTNRIVIFYKK